MDSSPRSFHSNNPERNGKEEQRDQGAYLKESIYSGIIRIRVHRICRIDIICPVCEPYG